MAHIAVEGNGYWLIWDAMEALEEWASAHSEIAIDSGTVHNGVAVLRARDTKYWEQKRKHGKYLGLPSVFHYDWSYSTPFCGKVEGGSWHEMKESGMKMSLLMNPSIPVIFFDDILLYEDDLHNNGQVQYAAKIRVTPVYAYVLARVYLCVNKVVIRVRETRVMFDYSSKVPKTYRDVGWKECAWGDLAKHKLPTEVKAWRLGEKEFPAFHAQLRSLPESDLPKDIPKYAALLPF